MSKAEAVEKAVQIARGAAEQKGVEKLCADRELREREHGLCFLRFLDREIRIQLRDGRIYGPDGTSVSPREELLVLHYLLSPRAVREEGEPVSFREFPGGIFYLAPFQGRTVGRLVGKIGNNTFGLSRALGSFRWTTYGRGDFGARIQALGEICLYIVYYCGDEEFGSRADILFDSRMKNALPAEDAVVLAELLCGRIITSMPAD